MTIRTILVALSGGAASTGAMEMACQLARRFDAHIEGFHVRADPSDAALVFGDGFGAPLPVELIDRTVKELEAFTATARRCFDEAVAAHGLPVAAEPEPVATAGAAGPSAAWREAMGSAATLVPQRGRLFDLVIVGRSERVVEQPHSDTLDETVVLTGRPLLVAPEHAPAELGRRIAVAWNGSVEAVHALAAAMPFLERAEAVQLLTVGTDEDTDTEGLAAMLRWRGITAAIHAIEPVARVGTGELLLAGARDQGADLLVMGAYGHALWREMLFGGATRDVVGAAMLPLLIAH
jgi:nucleotide-binding universal stress UspA family protein